MLPKGWQRTTLGEIGSVKSGGTPARSLHDRYFLNGKWPWVKTMDLTNSEISITDELITDLALEESSCKLFPPGTLLVAMYGGFKQIGRTGLLRNRSAVNQAISAIQLDQNRAHPEFVLHWLNGNVGAWKAFAASSRKDPNITRENVCDFPITLPTLPEQRRIAQVLSTWDQAIVKAERLHETSLKRRRGLTRDLVLGHRRFRQFNAGWQQLSFRDVLKEVKRRVVWDDDQEYPLISVRRRSEGAFHRETLKGSEILTKKLNYAYEGEFLISKMQVVHGAMAVVPSALDGMFVSDSYLAFHSADEQRFDINFIGWLSTTQQMYKAVRRCSYGVHIEKMTFDLDMFLNEKLQVPTDLEEQRLICSVLESVQVEAKSAADQLEQLRKEKAALMSQLLTGKRRVKLPEAESEAQA